MCLQYFLIFRVIQMIDENKEQLRKLFRTYNVVDVQPAVGDKVPDDISTLQVCETHCPTGCGTSHLRWLHFHTFPCGFCTAGHHHPGGAAVFGRNSVCNDELALSQSVRDVEFPLAHFSLLSTNHYSVYVFLLQTPKKAESDRCRINRYDPGSSW